MKSVIVILVLVTLVHGLRTRLLRQRLPARNHETFEGVIEQVGESVVAYRSAGPSPHQSVIAIHGFLEDFRYFTALYRDSSLELVLVNNSGYHCPVIGRPAARASWSEVDNPYPVGSIEHDAFVFNLALTHRVTGARVRAHGHSRGGAVILEAARQNPALFRDVEVILEAPVLPAGRGHPLLELAFSAPGRYLLPFTFTLLRQIDVVRFGGFVFAPLNPRKIELLRGLYFAPRTFQVVLDNLASMRTWIARRDSALFAHIPNGTILIGARDRVLDRAAMLRSARSARSAGARWQVIETRGTSHFVSLDQPGAVPAFQAGESSPVLSDGGPAG